MVKRFCLFLFALSSLLLAQNPVRVEAFDEQGNNPGRLTLRLRVTNSLPDTLQNVRLRYFLPRETDRSLQLSPYYLAGSSLSTDTVGGFLAVNVEIPKLAPGVFPNESGISFGMHYADYGDFEKGENFSYPGTDSLAETNRIPVYLDGVLFAGEAPLDGDKPEIRISGFQPEKSRSGQWVKLENAGEGAVDLRFLSLADSSDGDGLLDGEEDLNANGVVDEGETDPYVADAAGTIFAPKARLVLGQAKKEIYGRFVGNGITVHQYATLYAVPFAPETETAVAYFSTEEK